MSKLIVRSMQYGNESHDWIDCEVTEYGVYVEEGHPDNKEIASYTYTVAEQDRTEMNQELWRYTQEHLDEILPCKKIQIINGDLALPDDYAVVGRQLVNVSYRRLEVKGIINNVLQQLMSIENNARAEIDPAYKETRIGKIRDLLNIENQEGFPLEVDWPDFVWEYI